jgi:YegS/Rv2252/BmrU family lipid kinase
MNRHFRVLVNPTSGGGSAPATVAAVEKLVLEGGAQVTVEASRDAEHACLIVADAVANDQVVVAAGGDGMLASIAGAVVESGGVLGIIPSGRGNDFARMLRLSSDTESVAHALLEGDPTPVDVIETTDEEGWKQTVLGSMYAGVDSLASEIVDRSRRMPSALQYPYAAVRSLLTYTPSTFTVTVDGVPHVQDAFSVVVANSGYYGSGMHIAPMADVHDGLLDVVVLPAQSRVRMVRNLNKVYDGRHVNLPGVTALQGRTVRVEAEDVVAYGDGERIGPLPRTATVRPGAISVLLP